MHILEDGEVTGLQTLVEGVVKMQHIGSLEVPGVGSRLQGGVEGGREGGSGEISSCLSNERGEGRKEGGREGGREGMVVPEA